MLILLILLSDLNGLFHLLYNVFVINYSQDCNEIVFVYCFEYFVMKIVYNYLAFSLRYFKMTTCCLFCFSSIYLTMFQSNPSLHWKRLVGWLYSMTFLATVPPPPPSKALWLKTGSDGFWHPQALQGPERLCSFHIGLLMTECPRVAARGRGWQAINKEIPFAWEPSLLYDS